MKKVLWTLLAVGLMAPFAGCDRRDFDRGFPGSEAEDLEEAREETTEHAEEVGEEMRERTDEMRESDPVEEAREGDIEIRSAERGESDITQSTRGLAADDDTTEKHQR